MYFVTTKHPDYVLFAMTPSERAAIGVTEKQEVHLLAHDAAAGTWRICARWNAAEFSHTDFMAAWHYRDEPPAAEDLLQVLPVELRDAARQACLQ